MGGTDPSDDTIRLPRPARLGMAGRRGWLGGAAVALLLLAAGLWFGWRSVPLPFAPPTAVPPVVVVPPVIAPPVIAPPVVAPPTPRFAVAVADETAIGVNRTTTLAIFRFAANPQVLVLDFASLDQQAAMLNRIAALVEKRGLPRDHVLDDAALAEAIRAAGDTPATYYYGHDYRAADLARFFTLADRDHVRLTPDEQALRDLLRQEHYFDPQSTGALISIPRAGADPLIDAPARATILHHELSHGEYFSTDAYAAYARRYWHERMSDMERTQFRRFLASQDYDEAQEDLMVNETQAYLMHTPDPRFFSASLVGLTPPQLARLQAGFLAGMPAGWLRDATPAPASAPVVPASAASSPPRRAPRQRATVSRVTAQAARRPPPWRTRSIAAASPRR